MEAKPRKKRDPERYDEEYQALQATLEDYLREQVGLLSEAGRTAPAPTADEGWLRRHRSDLYFVVTLALIALLWWRTAPLPAPAAEPRPAESTASSTAEAPPPPVAPVPPPPSVSPPPRPDPPSELANPSAWWNGYVASHRAEVADWLVAISEARGIGGDQVSDLQKRNFKSWAAKVRSGNESAAERNYCRTGLFEYVFGRWVRGVEGATSQWGRVDLVVDAKEYATADLEKLLAELRRDHWFESVDREDAKLQTAVVLGWLESHQP